MQLSGFKKTNMKCQSFVSANSYSFSLINMEDNFRNMIISYYNQNEWQKILKLNEEVKSEIAKKILWVWPSEHNLKFIKDTVEANGLEGVISIGCGSGLFEWLLQQCTDLPVIGYEVNKEWWTSKYCIPQFISLQYPVMPPQTDYLNKDYALLFCYFNNGPAFAEYISAYPGKLVFIIGPGEGRGTHTNPEPFKPNFKTTWNLIGFEEVKDTKDFIAAYIKID